MLRPPAPPAGLLLPRSIRATLLAHLVGAAPDEGVGLLATASVLEAGGVARAVRFYPGANLDSSPTRYTMDPRDVLTALGDIDANGARLGAIVHSHPATPPIPSATDLREVYYPDALMVIVSLMGSPPELRAWRLVPQGPGDELAPWRAVEVPVVDGSGPAAADPMGSAPRPGAAGD